MSQSLTNNITSNPIKSDNTQTKLTIASWLMLKNEDQSIHNESSVLLVWDNRVTACVVCNLFLAFRIHSFYMVHICNRYEGANMSYFSLIYRFSSLVLILNMDDPGTYIWMLKDETHQYTMSHMSYWYKTTHHLHVLGVECHLFLPFIYILFYWTHQYYRREI